MDNTITAHDEPRPKPFEKVLIVGAGPAGLLLAILLARRRIKSTVFEAWDRVDDRLRATQYGVPASRVFRHAGILDDIRARGVAHFPSISWRSVRTGEVLAAIDMSVVSDDADRMAILPLSEILQIMLRHCRDKYAEHVTLLFRHKVVDVRQDGARVMAQVQVGDADKAEMQSLEADYLVGCDGAQSSVRKVLFQRHWPGETFESRLFVQNVYYKGFEDHGWRGANYMIDQEFWGLVARRADGKGARGPLWRVTYGDSAAADLTEAEYLTRRNLAFKKMLPGRPDPGQYEVTQTSMFRIHNRCVDEMRVDRVFLAGDAAHVCNPFGGYGCMAAVLDVAGLADCLAGYHHGLADESILDAYARVRRQKFLDVIDTRSRKNMQRVQNDADTVLDTDPFLALLKSMEGDAEATKAFLLKTSSIEYDFTSLYRT